MDVLQLPALVQHVIRRPGRIGGCFLLILIRIRIPDQHVGAGLLELQRRASADLVGGQRLDPDQRDVGIAEIVIDDGRQPCPETTGAGTAAVHRMAPSHHPHLYLVLTGRQVIHPVLFPQVAGLTSCDMPVLRVAADELYPGSVRPKPVKPFDIHRGGTQFPVILGKVQTAGELDLHHKSFRGVTLRRIDPFRIQQLVVQRLGKIGVVKIADGALVIGSLPGFQRHAFVVADRVVVDLHIKNVQRPFPGGHQPVQVFLVVPHFYIFTDRLPAALHRPVGQRDSIVLAFHGLRSRPGIGGVCLGIVMLPQVLLSGKTGNQGTAQEHDSRRRQERGKSPTADCNCAGTHEGASGNNRADAQGHDGQGDGRHDAQNPLAASALGDDGTHHYEITVNGDIL